jgi:hypothetical protein
MVMERFMLVKFQGHPVIVKEITMFMVTECVNPGDLTVFTTKLGIATTALADANTRVAKLESSIHELKRTFDNHIANSFKNLKDKVYK